MQKPPVLHLSDNKGIFQLYSDTSYTLSIQNGKLSITAHASKRMPEVGKIYSITELKLCGLAINIAVFTQLLKTVDFDAIVHHLVLANMSQSKAGPVTNKIKRFLEILNSYSLNLFYMKRKDMMLSDFPSRQKHDKSNPYEVIPISFDMQEVPHIIYYNIHKNAEEKYLIQTRSQRLVIQSC